MSRSALVLSAALLSAAAQSADVKPVRTVALVPAAEPLEYNITIKSAATFFIPLVGTATHMEGRANSRTFTEMMRTKAATPHGAYLTAQLAERLRGLGYQVSVLENLQRPKDDPDGIDTEKLAFDADVALQVRIDAIGYYSGFGSPAFVPKLNVSAMSFTPKGATYPYEGTVYYGLDAKPKQDWAIVSPPAYNITTFDEMAANPGKVDAVYREALEQIAERVVGQFKMVSPVAAAPQ